MLSRGSIARSGDIEICLDAADRKIVEKAAPARAFGQSLSIGAPAEPSRTRRGGFQS